MDKSNNFTRRTLLVCLTLCLCFCFMAETLAQELVTENAGDENQQENPTVPDVDDSEQSEQSESGQQDETVQDDGVSPLAAPSSIDQLSTIAAGAAYYLIDESSFTTRTTYDESIQSGWIYNNQGGLPKTADDPPYSLNDVSTSYGTSLIRDINAQTGGTLILETAIRTEGGTDGAYVALFNSSDEAVYKLYTDNGKFNVTGLGGTPIATSVSVAEGTKYFIRVEIDLDALTAKTIINRANCGTYDLSASFSEITAFAFGTTDEDKIILNPYFVTLAANYLYNQRFDTVVDGSSMVPDGFIKNVTGVSSVYIDPQKELHIYNPGAETCEVRSTFPATSGKILYESLLFFEGKRDNISFSLMDGTTPIVTFVTEGNAIKSGNTVLLENYLAQLWYKLRVEADTVSQTAVIKFNGKVVGTIPFASAAATLDGFQFAVNTTNGVAIHADNIYISVIPQVTDYVPAPVKPQKTSDVVIGINVCSLWRNGEHWGWDNITPFNEVKSVLGYYDDGLPEVADWEIKFMTEHGIDFQLYCWYSTESNAPIKTTRNSGALVDGFMNAQYSDQMKFALLWEAANASHPANSAAFRNYFVPYWTEYFFKDDRYMTIDNKLVIAVFGYNQLIADFGSAANVSTELDYVRSVAQGLGFDGAIFLACNSSSDTNTLQTIANCGFDGVYAYNWGKNGNELNVNINNINAQYNKNIIHVVPTISTGFNNVGWNGVRSPNMSVADFTSASEWVRDTALPRYTTNDWKKKMMVYSTWNEYGEGTYIMPSGLNGFGYLDAIRNTFTNGGAHTDVTPTAAQKSRLTHLFPQYRAIIRPLQTVDTAPPIGEVKQSWNYANGNTPNTTMFSFGNCTATASNGIVGIAPTNTDPLIQMRSNVNVDISDVYYIKVRMQAPAGQTMQVFFTTTADTSWTEKKSIKLVLDSSEMKDYYLPIYTKVDAGWNGTLARLRLDPVATKTNCSIESIALVKTKEKIFVTFNDEPATFTFDPVAAGTDDYLIPFETDHAIALLFNVYHRWNKDTQTLSIYGNGKKIVYHMGDSFATVDGVQVALGFATDTIDGIPMIPLKKTAELLGTGYSYTFNSTTKTANVETPQKTWFDIIHSRVMYQWEFNIPRDLEGWSYGSLTPLYDETGAIGGRPIQRENGSYDPVFSRAESFSAADYTKIKVSMKHEITTAESGLAKIYFYTDTTPISESTTVKVPIEKSSNGQYVEYTFDMSQNQYWNGTVKQIRFDPYDAGGDFYIDYIRLLP